MKIYRLIKWKNIYNAASPPIMKEHILFNWICIGQHFKGYKTYGLEIWHKNKLHCFQFDFINKKLPFYTKWNIELKNKEYFINLRLGKPLISISNEPILNRFKNVEVIT